MAAEPLRVLVAEARPLVLASQLWEADLGEPALAFLHQRGAPIAVLRDLDVGKMEVESTRLRFRLYPPWPADALLRQRLAEAMPQAEFSCSRAVGVLDTWRQGEQLEVLGQALAGTAKAVRLFYHPAVTLEELRRVVADLKPHVLHLVAHGDPEGHVLLEDGTGGARRVDGQVLSRAVGSQVGLFIDGSCHAGVLLERLFAQRGAKAFRAALGGDGSFTIPVRAVQLFAATLYPALASGLSLATAFATAVGAVRDDPLVGEAALPDGAERETGDDGQQVDVPSPWKRFQRHGAPGLAFRDVPAGEMEAVLLVRPSPHRRLARDDELFVGRHVEIAALAAALAPPRGGIREHKRRLVTLHGEGGIGKTRLAQAACEWLAERGRFPTGIAEVDCDGLRTAGELALKLLEALGGQPPPGVDPARALPAYLRDLPPDAQLLLLLDNLDDLFDPSAAAGPDGPGALLKECLTASAGLRLLATCRNPLGLGSDEEPFEVDPLRDGDAIQLFLEAVPDRDTRAGLRAMGTSGLQAALAPILEATSRMPLDLLLAAHRLTRHGESLATLVERSARELLDLLEDPSLKHLPPGRRSRRASLELSYRRLSVRARRLFARLSFFPGGVFRRLEPLDRLLGHGWREAAEDAAHLGLLRYDRERERYGMLNPVREYAREKLDAGEGDRFRRRAAGFWAGYATAFGAVLRADQTEVTPEEAAAGMRWQAVAALAAEEANLAFTAAWDLEGGKGRFTQTIAGGLFEYLELRARWHVMRALHASVAQAARARGAAASAAFFVAAAARAAWELGRLQEARLLLEEAVASYRRLARRRPDAYASRLAWSLKNLGGILADMGDPQTARDLLQEAAGLSRILAQRLPDRFVPVLAASLNNLGKLLADLGDPQAARRDLQESTDLFRTLAQRFPDRYLPDLAMSLNNLGAYLVGNPQAARDYLQESVAIRRTLAQRFPDRYFPNLAASLNNLGNRLDELGDPQAAGVCLREAAQISRQAFVRLPSTYRQSLIATLLNLARLELAAGERDAAAAAIDEAWALGWRPEEVPATSDRLPVPDAASAGAGPPALR